MTYGGETDKGFISRKIFIEPFLLGRKSPFTREQYLLFVEIEILQVG